MLNSAPENPSLVHVPEMEKFSGPVESLHAAVATTNITIRREYRLRIDLPCQTVEAPDHADLGSARPAAAMGR